MRVLRSQERIGVIDEQLFHYKEDRDSCDDDHKENRDVECERHLERDWRFDHQENFVHFGDNFIVSEEIVDLVIVLFLVFNDQEGSDAKDRVDARSYAYGYGDTCCVRAGSDCDS